MGEDDKGKNATIRRRPTRRAHEGFVFCLSRFRMGGKRCGSGAITQADLTRDGAQGMAAFAVYSRNALIAFAAGALAPLELIERRAALIPPPRRHRHRCCGVLAPNAPLRSAGHRAGGLLSLRKRPLLGQERDAAEGNVIEGEAERVA